MISNIPTHLQVRQLGMETYPSRALYTIEFNSYKMADRIRKRALINENVTLSALMYDI